jgi:cytidylate kinase
VAKLVAAKLGFSYLDTGALYRSSALKAHRLGLALEDSPQLRRMMEEIVISFDGARVLLDGEDVSEAIRTPEISHLSSVISAIPVVREMLLPLQRRIGEKQGIVADGRDMCTVVFPDAINKFFIDASIEERARRRFLELSAKGIETTLEAVLEDVRVRDERDSSREAAPLRRADDAIYILTDGLNAGQVADMVLSMMKATRK